MLARVNAPKELIAGAIYIVVGTALFFGAQNYPIGTARQMGPGYFPALVGLVLLAFGIAAFVKGLLAKKQDPLPDNKVMPLVMLLASVISFALLIESAGLVIASFFCIGFACYQRWRTKPLEVFLTYLGVTIFNVVVFIEIFGLPFKIFWWD
jgi:predicted MFS family arabinose efflux permease